jgi:multidrug transporter EmrE-like cation transporter
MSNMSPLLRSNHRTVPIIILPASIVLSIDESQTNFEETLFCVPLGVYEVNLTKKKTFLRSVQFQTRILTSNALLSATYRLLNIVLLLAWRNIPMHIVFKIQHKTLRMSLMVIGSIVAWTIMAVIMRFIIHGLEKVNVTVHYPALAAFGIQVFVAMFVTVFGDRYTAKGEGKVKWKLYVMAGVLGFITGVGLVFLSDADDTSGGLLLSFPVILIASVSSLASTYAETLPITATTAMIGGSVSTSLYAIIFAESLPLFDRLFQPPDTAVSFKPASLVVATIVCWFSCLILISLPILFILRCLAKREKGSIEKVNWNTEQGERTDGGSFDSRTITAGWDETFGSDDEDDDNDTLTNESSSLLGRDSFVAKPSLHSESDNAARRAILEENIDSESPLLFSGVSIPDSPVPTGSSRMASLSNSVSNLRTDRFSKSRHD